MHCHIGNGLVSECQVVDSVPSSWGQRNRQCSKRRKSPLKRRTPRSRHAPNTRMRLPCLCLQQPAPGPACLAATGAIGHLEAPKRSQLSSGGFVSPKRPCPPGSCLPCHQHTGMPHPGEQRWPWGQALSWWAQEWGCLARAVLGSVHTAITPVTS